MIKKFKWQFMIRLKKGSMPAFHREYQEYLPIYPENRAQYTQDYKTTQKFQWVNDIEYSNGKSKVIHKLHVLECFETKIKNKKGDKKRRRFLWISSLRVSQKNCEKLSNKGGRCRWKIENQGFKSQKREGYELEHAYSEDCNAIKCFYHLLQVAHTINQLIEKGGLIKNIARVYGSKKNYYEKFLNAFTEYVIDSQFVEQIINSSFQIRLDSS